MRYIIAGDGTMPLKEIPDVIEELNPTPDDEVIYVCGPQTRYKVGETVMEGFKTFVVAVPSEEIAADLSPKLQGADDIVLWDPEVDMLPGAPSEVELLAMIPAEDEPVDTLLEELVAMALDSGIRCRAMNEQMYTISLDGTIAPEGEEAADTEPLPPEAEDDSDEDEGTGQPVEVPTATAMESMPRADLKALAKEVGAQPEDWRSKQKIIDAILQTQVTGEPYGHDEAPSLDDLEEEIKAIREEEQLAVDSLAEEAPAQTVRVEGMEVPIPTAVSPRDPVVVVLEELLGKMTMVINEARQALEDL